MKKNKINLIIDIIMMLIMMIILSIGLLVKYILPTGQEKWERYGENREFLFMNLDRHQWGEIHYILGYILIGLLILHIILHWKQVVCIYKQWITIKIIRVLLAWFFLIIISLILLIPFVLEPKTGEDESHYKNKTNMQLIQDKQAIRPDEDEHIHSDININGQMNLSQISEKYNIACDEIKKELGIPLTISNNERLGRLRKLYNFNMQEVKDIINNHQKLTYHE